MTRKRSRRTQPQPPPERAGQPPPAAPPPPREEAAPVYRPSAFARWLTVERLIWGGIIFLAAAVRLLDLAHISLNDAEARIALAALDLFRGNPETSAEVSPFVVGVNALIFLIFGANDATARILTAVAGIAPVALTYRLRALLGRGGAMLAALMLAFSPIYLYYSRIANGEMVAVAGMYAALTSIDDYLRRRDGRALYLIAGGAAIALTGGQATYTVLLVVVSFTALVYALRAGRSFDTSDWDAALSALRASPLAARNAALVFALVFLAGATGGLLNPLGLQAAVNLAAQWFAQWTQPPNQPASYFLQLFMHYELLPLAFGLGGVFYSLARGDRFSMFAAWWLGVSLTIYTFAPHKSGAGMLVVLIPLVWSASRAIASLLESLTREFAPANDGIFIALGLITIGILGINVSAYAQAGQSNHLIVAAIAFGMLLLIGVLVATFASLYRPVGESGGAGGGYLLATAQPDWRIGFARAAAVLGTIFLLALSALFLHASFNLNFNEAEDPREPLVDLPTTMEARTLKPMLEDLSNRWEGDPRLAAIAADTSIGSALRWYLRDFKRVRYFDDPPATAAEPIVIVAAKEKQPGFAGYVGQKMRWRWLEPDMQPDAVAFFRWFMFRGIHDVPPSYDIIVYVQQK